MRELAYTIEAGDASYPEALHHLPDPPHRLWAIGDRELLTLPIVAIVGTRRATSYGERVARELASAMARAGACVMSGMARGIDAVAHVAALESSSRTIAVLGTGVDLPYPVGHRALHRRIARDGLLLSEFPLGAHAHRGSFPKRNRLIAALARLTIVVEAPRQSGALNTAKCAGDLGRDVGAVPGPIDGPQSAGCNNLLRDGAQVITSAEDALALMGLTPPLRTARDLDDPDQLSVWSVLAEGASDLDALCHRSSLPVQRCLAAVTALELRGAIECCLTGEIRRR